MTHNEFTSLLNYMQVTSSVLELSHASSLLTQAIIQKFRGSGPKDSDTLCVALRDVHGELIALGQLGGASGPQHHDRHVLQICTCIKTHVNVHMPPLSPDFETDMKQIHDVLA